MLILKKYILYSLLQKWFYYINISISNNWSYLIYFFISNLNSQHIIWNLFLIDVFYKQVLFNLKKKKKWVYPQKVKYPPFKKKIKKSKFNWSRLNQQIWGYKSFFWLRRIIRRYHFKFKEQQRLFIYWSKLKNKKTLILYLFRSLNNYQFNYKLNISSFFLKLDPGFKKIKKELSSHSRKSYKKKFKIFSRMRLKYYRQRGLTRFSFQFFFKLISYFYFKNNLNTSINNIFIYLKNTNSVGDKVINEYLLYTSSYLFFLWYTTFNLVSLNLNLVVPKSYMVLFFKKLSYILSNKLRFFYLQDLAQFIFLAIKYKKINLLVNWLKQSFEKRSFKLYRQIISLLKILFFEIIFTYSSLINIIGLRLTFNGKLLKGGKRKRAIVLKRGLQSFTKKSISLEYRRFYIRSISGIVGCELRIYYL